MNTTKQTLFEIFEIDKMDPEKGEELLNKISKIIFQSVLVRTLPMLTEEKQKEYDQILESDNGENLFIFLRDNIENFEEIIREEGESLKKELFEK